MDTPQPKSCMACAKNKSVQRQEVGSCCPVVEDYYVDDTVGP